MTDQNSADDLSSDERLAYLLVDLNILSPAQLELALADQEINEIGLEEVVLARGWITQAKLYTIAPWLKPDFHPTKDDSPHGEHNSRKSKVSSIQHPLQDWHAEPTEEAHASSEPSSQERAPQELPKTGGKQNTAKGKSVRYEENLAAYRELKKKTFGN